MKKKIKKLTILLLINMLLCIFANSVVNAAEIEYTLNAIKMNADTLRLENNQGYLENKITFMNAEEGEVTVELSLNNKKVEEEDGSTYEETEIFILVPEYMEGDKAEIIGYIETLTNKVCEVNNNTKIGIIGIMGPRKDVIEDEEGNQSKGENDQGSVLGSSDNSEIVVDLTRNVSEIINGLETMNFNDYQYYINLESALELASNSFSNNVNKIIISLYDNVPKTANGVKNAVVHGGSSPYDTVEEAVIAKNRELVSRTKQAILNLRENNIDFILLRPDDTSFDQKWYNSETGELSLEFDGTPYVLDLYGTIENPTYGTMYSLNNASLETIVTDYIYSDIVEEIGTTMEGVTVRNYFSQDILDNFEIEFINSTNLDITHLDTEGYVIWNVGTLETANTATLEYTLKIKNMNNEELIDKEITISDRVELSYTDYLGEVKEAETESSPTLELTRNSSDTNNGGQNSNQDDDTTAPGTIPQTGETIFIISIITVLTLIIIIGLIKLKKVKDIK